MLYLNQMQFDALQTPTIISLYQSASDGRVEWATKIKEHFATFWRCSDCPIAQIPLLRDVMGGSVAEWLACWTEAHKGPGSNRSRNAVGWQS